MKKKVVIIGSGMAGLYAGALLAKTGWHVTVLEKEPTPGGLLAGFKRKGVWFDTGVHYLGALAKGQVLWKYFEALDLFSDCEFEEMDQNGFEEYWFPDMKYAVPTGEQAFVEKLSACFPQEARGIQRCIDDWRAIVKNFPLYNPDSTLRPDREQEILADPIARMSLQDYLETHIADSQCRSLLSANGSLYGLVPKECPVYIHALIFHSFIQSAWKFKHSSMDLVKALVKRIKQSGGTVRCSAEVCEVLSSQGKAQAVRLTNGDVISAEGFIATVHPKTMLTWMREKAVRPIYRKRVSGLSETIASSCLYLVVREDAAFAPDRNYFIHQSWDMASQYSLGGQGMHAPHTLFVTSSGASQNGYRAVTIIFPDNWERWADWRNSSRGSRPKAYQEQKAALAQAVLDRMEQLSPGFKDKIVYHELSTPLTLRDYTGTQEGSTYGIKKPWQQLREATLSVRTRLGNFYLAGQSIVLPGVLGVCISAVAASGALAGFEKIMKCVGVKK